MGSIMNTKEKLRIILNWCHKFEYVDLPHVTEGVTVRMFTSQVLGKHNIPGRYELTCDSKKEAIHAAYRALQEHIWWKVQHTIRR